MGAPQVCWWSAHLKKVVSEIRGVLYWGNWGPHEKGVLLLGSIFGVPYRCCHGAKAGLRLHASGSTGDVASGPHRAFLLAGRRPGPALAPCGLGFRV